MSFDLKHLRSFLVLSDEMNFTRAAEQLAIPQSTLSQRIQALEHELRVNLIDRKNPKKIKLTASGEALLSEARHLVQQAERAQEVVQNTARGTTGKLRIGFMGSATSFFLYKTIRSFRKANPFIEVSLLDLSPTEQRERLFKGEIDFGFCRDVKSDEEPTLRSMVVYQDRLVLAVASDSQISGPINLKSIHEEQVALYDSTKAPWLAQVIESAFHREDTVRPQGPTLASMNALLLTVASGLAVALVPECVKNLGQPGVRFEELAGERIELPVYGVCLRSTSNPAVKIWLKHLHSELAADGFNQV